MVRETYIKVWRIVDSNGDGMYTGVAWKDPESEYRTKSLWGLCCGDSDFSDQHPMPHQDGIVDCHSGHFFGFKSINHMKDWVHVPEWRKKMTEHGGRMKCFLVPVDLIRIGCKQVAFDMLDARVKEIASYPVDMFG